MQGSCCVSPSLHSHPPPQHHQPSGPLRQCLQCDGPQAQAQAPRPSCRVDGPGPGPGLVPGTPTIKVCMSTFSRFCHFPEFGRADHLRAPRSSSRLSAPRQVAHTCSILRQTRHSSLTLPSVGTISLTCTNNTELGIESLHFPVF